MSKEKSPAFQFYLRDLLSDINWRMMNYPERGMYWELVSVCWLEGSLPADIGSLARLLQISPEQLENAWQIIGKCFIADACDCHKLLHPRLELERKKQREHSKIKSIAGVVGAKSRWNNHKKTNNKMATAFFDDGKRIADDSSSSSSSSSSSDTKTNSASEFSLLLKDGTSYEITNEQIREFQSAYPGVDVREQLRIMQTWCNNNEPKRKTRRGTPRFINQWLNSKYSQPDLLKALSFGSGGKNGTGTHATLQPGSGAPDFGSTDDGTEADLFGEVDHFGR